MAVLFYPYPRSRGHKNRLSRRAGKLFLILAAVNNIVLNLILLASQVVGLVTEINLRMVVKIMSFVTLFYSCKALIDTALIDTFFTCAVNGVVQQNFDPKVKIFFFITVVTSKKGQSTFVEVGSNKRISGIPLFVIFEK